MYKLYSPVESFINSVVLLTIMNAKINDVTQFLVYCELHHITTEIMEEEYHLLNTPINDVKKQAIIAINNSLSKKNFFSKFVKENKLSIYDLDLIQIAITQKTNTISLETYIEKSILSTFCAKDVALLIKTLSSTKIIKEGYLTLENPYTPETTKISKKSKKQKDLTELLNTVPSLKLSKKKLSISFRNTPFKRFDELMDHVFFLDKLLNKQLNIKNGTIQSHLKFLVEGQLQELKSRYNHSLKGKNEDFIFFKENELHILEVLTLIKCLTSGFDYEKRENKLSPTFQLRLVNSNSYSILERKGLIKNEGFGYILTNKARQGILGRASTETNDELYKIETPKETLNKVSLSQETKTQILQTINQIQNKDQIFNTWGLAESINYGKGITLNFYGAPGTGKTLAVRAIANHLNKKLLTINYPGLENKYMGETEKNIEKAFKQAEEQDAILFFDEADSVTTKRETSNYSWEITRTNTLLKELENFEGICIFATNFATKYDEAFNRRLSAHVEFKLPEEEQLLEILDIHFPKKDALSEDVNFKNLVKNFKGIFSGGDIKNLVLNAARIAANDEENTNKKINQRHLQEACKQTINSKAHTTHNIKQEVDYFG
jgi:ATP-dependent 26S proteasome regulatory subunit